MKYIRTKDGRIIENEAYLRDGRHRRHCKCADTIEELCDEGVCDNSLVGFTDIRGFELYKKYECFGAIWTDKGLIYVAKMNEDGKLCLI